LVEFGEAELPVQVCSQAGAWERVCFSLNPAEGDPAGNIILRVAPPVEEAHEARAGSLARFSGRGAGAALYQ